MAHPHLKEARDGHGAKLAKMTTHYGAADPSANIANPQTRAGGKEEGPEESIGFGAESGRPAPSAAKRGRDQMVSNPVATLRRGGATKRAHGGRAKGKGKHGTHVNVIVAPQGGGGPGAMPVRPVPPMLPGGPPPAAAMPPRPPMGPPPMGGPPPGAPPMAPGAPGGMPPGLMPPRKRGGRVHSDAKEDKKLIESELKKHHLVRARGGLVGETEGGLGGDAEMAESRSEQGLKGPDKVERHNSPPRKHHMTAGALSGPGRLEKIGKKAHDAGRPQEV